MILWCYAISRPVLIKCPSWIAANVAIQQTTIALYWSSIKNDVKGNKNSNNPVTLFIMVCSTTNLFLQTNPDAILMSLMIAITVIHIYSQLGIWITGSSLTKHAPTNRKSATVSNLDPNSLTVFVFLAMVPSIISVKPQVRYRI